MISVLRVKGMLKGGIEKGRVVVGRRRALLRLPVTLQDGRLVATVTGLVRQHPLVLAHCEGEKPEAEKETESWKLCPRQQTYMDVLQCMMGNGPRRGATTCWVSCPWRRCRASDVSVPPIAGPCRCRSAHPGKEKTQGHLLRSSLSKPSVRCLTSRESGSLQGSSSKT